MRALRGAGPLRLRSEKRARKRSAMGREASFKRSQRNFSISEEQEKEVISSSPLTEPMSSAEQNCDVWSFEF